MGTGVAGKPAAVIAARTRAGLTTAGSWVTVTRAYDRSQRTAVTPGSASSAAVTRLGQSIQT